MPSPDVETDLDAFTRVAGDVPPEVRVPVEVQVTVADPFNTYRRARDGPGEFHLKTGCVQDG